jgi:hypothetical protein
LALTSTVAAGQLAGVIGLEPAHVEGELEIRAQAGFQTGHGADAAGILQRAQHCILDQAGGGCVHAAPW